MFAEPPTASTMHAAITAGVASMRSPRFLLAAVCHCVPLSALGAPKARQCRQASRNGNYALRCSAIASAMVFRRTRSPYLPQRPFRLHSTMQNPAIVVKNHRFLPPIRSVATEKVVSYLSHTLRSRVVTQNEARPGVTWNLRIVICEFHVVPGLFLFSGDFRQSKPDLACGRGATRQARPVNGERTRQ